MVDKEVGNGSESEEHTIMLLLVLEDLVFLMVVSTGKRLFLLGQFCPRQKLFDHLYTHLAALLVRCSHVFYIFMVEAVHSGYVYCLHCCFYR